MPLNQLLLLSNNGCGLSLKVISAGISIEHPGEFFPRQFVRSLWNWMDIP